MACYHNYESNCGTNRPGRRRRCGILTYYIFLIILRFYLLHTFSRQITLKLYLYVATVIVWKKYSYTRFRNFIVYFLVFLKEICFKLSLRSLVLNSLCPPIHINISDAKSTLYFCSLIGSIIVQDMYYQVTLRC